MSSKHLLAVVVVLDIALNSNSNGRPVASRDLARRYGLAPRGFEPILQELVRHGVLRGIRGPLGGYALARRAEDISVLDIVRAGAGLTQARDSRIRRGDAVISAIMTALSEAEEHFAAKLKQISVRDLILRAE
jgi:Rrf2 family protein